jgi:hypothetical protein
MNTEIELLSRLADLAGEHAKRVLVDLGQPLMPQWVLVDARGGCDIVGTPWRDDQEKELTIERLRNEMRKRKVKAYSLVIEAWTAVAPKGWKEGEPRMPNWQRPDRREVVIAFATDGKSIQWRQWMIKRDWHDHVVALEPIPFEGDAKPSSWMSELLSSRSTQEPGRWSAGL